MRITKQLNIWTNLINVSLEQLPLSRSFRKNVLIVGVTQQKHDNRNTCAFVPRNPFFFFSVLELALNGKLEHASTVLNDGHNGFVQQ